MPATHFCDNLVTMATLVFLRASAPAGCGHNSLTSPQAATILDDFLEDLEPSQALPAASTSSHLPASAPDNSIFNSSVTHADSASVCEPDFHSFHLPVSDALFGDVEASVFLETVADK